MSPAQSLEHAAIAVIGAGSWGTALAKLLSDQGRDVILWGHRREHVAAMVRDRENVAYLPGFSLSANLKLTADIREAVSGRRLVLMVTPSHVFREVFHHLLPSVSENSCLLSAAKGIENNTLMTMTQVMADVVASFPEDRRLPLHFGTLSGPSFAREVAQGIPTAVTVAFKDLKVAKAVQKILFSERFRVYTSTDIIGQELGGALKNIIAIAVGICDGLGYGTNTRAALITRGLAEISRMGVKMGADPLTFSGLGGLGDLVLTCTGDLSRNRMVGLKLGKGMKLADILAEMNMVAEGVKTTRSAMALAEKIGVEMPILEQIFQVFYRDKPCHDAVMALLSRESRGELG